MMAITFRRVSSLTPLRLLMTSETDAGDTPASAAISRMVMEIPHFSLVFALGLPYSRQPFLMMMQA